MVEHICIGDEAISLYALDVDAEDATGNHHSNLGVLLKGELFILGHLCANGVVVLLNVADFFGDLVLERTAFEPSSLLLSVKNGEVVEGFGQNVDVLVEERDFLPALLHNVSGQERVLRRDEALAEVACLHKGANGGLHCHFEGNDFILRYVKDCLSFLNVTSSMHSSVVWAVVSQLKFVEKGSS